MAKLTKSQLKGIVKECLVEILTEGLAPSSHLIESRGEPRRRTTSQKRVPTRASSPALDKVMYTPSVQETVEPVPHNNFNSAVDTAVSGLTNDPVMSQIFADTARTTLQEQMHGDSKPGAVSMTETAAPGVDIGDIDIFSGPSKNWAALAFADNTSK